MVMAGQFNTAMLLCQPPSLSHYVQFTDFGLMVGGRFFAVYFRRRMAVVSWLAGEEEARNLSSSRLFLHHRSWLDSSEIVHCEYN